MFNPVRFLHLMDAWKRYKLKNLTFQNVRHCSRREREKCQTQYRHTLP